MVQANGCKPAWVLTNEETDLVQAGVGAAEFREKLFFTHLFHGILPGFPSDFLQDPKAISPGPTSVRELTTIERLLFCLPSKPPHDLKRVATFAGND
jgi:hypothetical protein